MSVLLSNIGRLFSGVTQPNTQTHARASPTPTHTTRNMESIDNQSEETVVAAAAAATSIMMGLIQQEDADEEDCAGAHPEEEEEPKAKQRRRSYTRPGYMKSVWGQWLERVAELHASDDGLDEDCREARQFVVAFRVPYEMFRGIVEAVAPAFPSATHDVAGRECIPLELKVRLCWCSFLFLVHRPVRGEPVLVGRFNFSETEFTTAVGSSRGVGGMNTLV